MNNRSPRFSIQLHKDCRRLNTPHKPTLQQAKEFNFRTVCVPRNLRSKQQQITGRLSPSQAMWQMQKRFQQQLLKAANQKREPHDERSG